MPATDSTVGLVPPAAAPSLPPLAPSATISLSSLSSATLEVSPPRPQREQREVVELAEHGQWEAVIDKCHADPSLAQVEDEFGMLPLHWACTEPSIPLECFERILSFFPQACQQDNLSGMLPIHVAITSRMPGLHINALLLEYPQALLIKDRMNKYPIDLAIESNLPKFTIGLIQKYAGSQTVTKHYHPNVIADAPTSSGRGGSKSVSSSSCDSSDFLSPTSTIPILSRSPSSESFESPDSPIPDGFSNGNDLDSSVEVEMDPTTNACLTSQLKELVAQIQQLGADIRSSSISSASTYRSSLSSSSSYRCGNPVYQVLWNPGDRLGITFDALQDDCGARITKINPKSDALGIESLQVGDALVSINGASVSTTRHASIMRFLKHSKATCKLKFCRTSASGLVGNTPSSLLSASSSSSLSSHNQRLTPEGSTGSMELDQDTLLYARVVEMLDATLKRVRTVEERIRRTSAIS